MRDALPPGGARTYERGIINLDSAVNRGTHWTAYQARPDELLYFDSFGLPPPRELVTYLRKTHPNAYLQYSTFKIQKATDGPICGHLCIRVLRGLAKGDDFLEIILKIYG